MARTLNNLTDRQIKASAYKGNDQKLFDGGGLYLLINKGGKYWRFKYRHLGKEKLSALGVYPQVSLADARKKRDELKKQISDGLDPNSHKKEVQRKKTVESNNTFQSLALEWYEEIHSHDVSHDHARKNLERLQKYIFPKLGDSPINEIKPSDLLQILRELEKRGILETVSRVKNLCGQVFRYAITTERAERDITADLKGALKTPKENHHPAITDPIEAGQLLRVIDTYSGHISTFTALKLAPYVFVRPGELRQMKWEDLDLELGIWKYKPSKNGLPFDYPLANQVLKILKEHQYLSGKSPYVFPSVKSNFRPMSNGTLSSALIRLEYKGKMTVHGFRALARTILAEKLNFKPEYIEQQLGHNVRDALGRAYNRTTYFEQRKEMMQKWADYLDELRK